MTAYLNYYSQKCNITNFHKSQNNKNIGFQGLNRCLAKNFITGQKDIVILLEANNKSRGFVGNLPAEWIKQLPKENRKTHVQQIQDMFSNLTEKLYSPHGTEFEKNAPFVAEFLDQLKHILNTNVDIEHIAQGRIGKSYKLSVGNSHYELKNIHSDMDPFYSVNNGNVFEPSKAPYVNKKCNKAFIDFYFGKIGTPEREDCFILTKYEDPQQKLSPTEEVKRLLRILKSRVSSIDIEVDPYISNDNNMIGRKIIDFGCLKMLPQSLHEEFKKLTKDIEKYYFTSKKTPDKKAAILAKINKMKDSLYTCMTYSKIRSNFRSILQILEEHIQKPIKNPEKAK